MIFSRIVSDIIDCLSKFAGWEQHIDINSMQEG